MTLDEALNTASDYERSYPQAGHLPIVLLGREVRRLRAALAEIREEWAGAECGQPVYAQEAYAIGLARRMYEIAASVLTHNASFSGVRAEASTPLEARVSTMECPSCKGRGKTGPVHVNYGYDERIGGCRGEWKESVPCYRCKGAGSVPDEMAEWIAAGKVLRDARVARGESLNEAAKRLGMSSADLSAIEHGRKSANASFSGVSAAKEKP